MQVIHEHNQQQHQADEEEEVEDEDEDQPLSQQRNDTPHPSPKPTTTIRTRSTPSSFSPILLGLLLSTAVLRVVWVNLRVPAGVDATTLLPADAHLGVLVACSIAGTVLRCLFLHYTTAVVNTAVVDTAMADTTTVPLVDNNRSKTVIAHPEATANQYTMARPARHFFSLFALLLAQSAVWTHWAFR